jgi:NAD-dependent deacetylase
VVYPAAGLPVLAARRGVPVVEVSPAATDLTPLATWSLRTTAAVGLPELVDAAVS